MSARLATVDDRILALVQEAMAATSDEHPHITDIDEVKRMSTAEFLQRIADYEKQYIQLRADSPRREIKRAKQSGKASKKRSQA